MTQTGTESTIRAVVIEDSAASRALVVGILEAEGDIAVVGQGETDLDAIELVLRLRPDIVTLDLYLPDGGSRHAIEQIMARSPTPILVLAHARDDARSACVEEALVSGALDALARPSRWTRDLESELRRTVRLLRKAHVVRHPRGTTNRADKTPRSTRLKPQERIVAVAASTGGPSALAVLLSKLSGLTAPVLVVQHLHADFTAGLVDWMSRESALPVELAEHGQLCCPGRVYIAPGGAHLRLLADSRLELDPNPATIHRPSADQLFLSVAEHAGASAVGVLLTGMGDDGARGLLAIRQAGGRTLAQDEASSAVFGMPAAAQRLGAVTEMLPPAQLARAITHASRELAR